MSFPQLPAVQTVIQDARIPAYGYVCIVPDCSYRPTGHKGVSQHFHHTHIGRKWNCQFCDTKFKTAAALKNHGVHKHFQDPQLQTSDRYNDCNFLHACPFDLHDDCRHIFTSREDFGKHMGSHINEHSCHDLKGMWSGSTTINHFLLYGQRTCAQLASQWDQLLSFQYDLSNKPRPTFSWEPQTAKSFIEHLERKTLPQDITDEWQFAWQIWEASD